MGKDLSLKRRMAIKGNKSPSERKEQKIRKSSPILKVGKKYPNLLLVKIIIEDIFICPPLYTSII